MIAIRDTSELCCVVSWKKQGYELLCAYSYYRYVRGQCE